MAQAIQVRFRSHHLPETVEAAIRAEYQAPSAAAPVAVRSSATAEDLPDASYGLEDLKVSGIVTPDTYPVEKVLMEVVERKISDKHVELVPDPDAATTVEHEVGEDRRRARCLTDREILAVAELPRRLERQNGCPQDVEWAFDADLPDGENLLALQSRPETVWSQKPMPKPETGYATGMAGIIGAFNNPSPATSRSSRTCARGKTPGSGSATASTGRTRSSRSTRSPSRSR